MKQKIMVSAITSLIVSVLWTSLFNVLAKENEVETTVAETISVTEVTTEETTVEETTDIPSTTVKFEDIPDYTELGTFKLTAYCSCSKCCGKSDGITASGKKAKANHTVAVDRNLIPFGTELMINGETYIAEDTGGAVQGMVIDIYFDSHEEAENFGVKYAKVFEVN
jgi:3D (Asp-Asp-Asp) domain-containing protein